MENEAKLAEAVVQWLESQHWDVYQEVQVRTYSSRADIVAVQQNLVWVIECKRTLGISVMDQASRWRSHFRSVAVPNPKRWTHNRQVAEAVAKNYFKVGIIRVTIDGTYSTDPDVREFTPAPLMREYHEFAKVIRDTLRPEHKTHAKAGSRGGNYITPYRITVNAIKHFLRANPGGVTLKEIFDDLGKMHYASMKSAKSTMRLNLMTIESDWCRIDKRFKPPRYFLKHKET